MEGCELSPDDGKEEQEVKPDIGELDLDIPFEIWHAICGGDSSIGDGDSAVSDRVYSPSCRS
jgi:hypothetical protein